ncbi:MAG: CoA-binding protein [Kineosporiaceae bacterium]|nr:CoA-binding protein [Kineosporiaceae bacterium]MBK7621894.1 CoA-binding protein [Kineosporiaceae bacterium]MBK8074200.1 CoA-binding protein [Kineosporiaceae bacterium]
MVSITEAAAEFLTARRIAVTGVSRQAGSHGGNAVLTGLRSRGFEVIPVNPAATEVEGVRCYPTVTAIPGGVDAVVIATRPEHAAATVRECAELGITKVWMHRSFGGGSFSQDAVDVAAQLGVRLIPGGCPLMFGAGADRGHRFMRGVCRLTGAVPRQL